MKTFTNRLIILTSLCLINAIVTQAQVTDTLRREPAVATQPDTTFNTSKRLSDENLSDFERPGSPWFQRNAAFIGLGLGFAIGKGQGLYTAFTPRVGFFLQRGFAIGLRGAFESRAKTSYRANSAGAFVRYYPVQNNFYVFGEGGFNIGKFRSSDVGPNDKRGFSSLNIGAGLGVRALDNLSFELMIENNYYDKAPVYAGNNRGPQIKLGANFHISSRR
ncbi:outer membrane protein [Larkinella bovis]|uniref:Outer membrane protein n=1 Tax=Larkinella bovis TaxID=683041 RepID=A0ABW0IKF0_9BACT